MKPTTRRVVTRAPARTVRQINLHGLLPAPVEAESALEADFIVRAALNPAVREIRHQPFVLPAGARGYTPDFLVTLAVGQPVVAEVKIDRRIEEYAERFDAAAAYLAERGFLFVVLSERSIRRGNAHKRAELIRRYVKGSYSETDQARVLGALKEHPLGVPLGTLAKQARVQTDTILHLIARRSITTGPQLNLTASTLVFRTDMKGNNHENRFDRWFGVTPWRKNA